MNRICELFNIRFPIVQGGMVWVSGGRLAAAVSNAGGLGLVGAGSMDPDLLRHHIRKAHSLTDRPFGVNIPIFSNYAGDQVNTSISEGVRIFFMSAGSPRTFTGQLKEAGCTVVHVTATPTLAGKCQAAGVDAVVVEGFEAGGHNGRDELTTFVLIPQTRDVVSIPVIAAGGIADGRGIAAAMALGADGVQLGTRFAVTEESSASENYKQAIVRAGDTDTLLTLKGLMPVRLVKNKLTEQILRLEATCPESAELQELVGKGAARRAIMDGDVEGGEIEAGQISGLIRDIPDVQTCMKKLVTETAEVYRRLAPQSPGSSIWNWPVE